MAISKKKTTRAF